jgi:hypothetical protein
MRFIIPLAAALALAACGQGHSQADQLDNAANQADPAAAAVMHNEADEIRANGSDTDLSAGNGAVQQAMQNAGVAAADAPSPYSPSPEPASSPAGAKPHHPGDPVPPPQTR